MLHDKTKESISTVSYLLTLRKNYCSYGNNTASYSKIMQAIQVHWRLQDLYNPIINLR